MKRFILTLITGALMTLAAPAGALAAGGSYFPAVTTPSAPASHTSAKQAVSKSAAQPSTPACDGPAAPAMGVYSPSENPLTEHPAGTWALDLYYSGQTDAEWTVNWTGSAGTTYDFEVSASSATDSTGKFVSPIAADKVTGTATQSNDMTILSGQTFYFQLNATGTDGCPGKYVTGKITALFDPAVPLATKSHNGPQGTQLFGLALVGGLALVVVRRYLDLRAGRGRSGHNDELYV